MGGVAEFVVYEREKVGTRTKDRRRGGGKDREETLARMPRLILPLVSITQIHIHIRGHCRLDCATTSRLAKAPTQCFDVH